MNLRRILANAIARRIAFVLIATLLAWLGLGDAHAQSGCPANSQPSSGSGCGSQGAAYSACKAADAAYTGAQSQSCESATMGATWGYYACTRNGTATGCNTAGRYYYFRVADSCLSGGSQQTQFLPLTGSTQCWNGCVVSYMQNGDDTTSTRSPTGAICSDADFKQNCPVGSFWNGHMGVCQPITPDCPTGQVAQQGVCKPENQCPDGMVAVTGGTPGAVQSGALYCKPAETECPPGNIKSPTGQCLPGEGQCAAGEARRPNGTCGRDSDGDGTADDDDDNPDNDTGKGQFSGGDTCNAPPSCNGDAIMCGQARIQWRIDCNTRKNVNVSGGSCAAVPVCTGEKCNAMEYNSLLMQWRTACATEKLAKQSPGAGGDGQPDWTKVTGDGTAGQGEEPDGPHRTVSLGLGMLDQTGFFGGGGCPQFGTVDLGYFGSVNLDQFDWICRWLAAVKIVIIAMGGWVAFQILGGIRGFA